MVDLKKLEEAARLIIEAVGDDPTREGLVETPKRFADMMAEQFAYMRYPMKISLGNLKRPSKRRRVIWSW